MKIKPFQALYPRFDLIGSPDAFCDKAKDQFPEFREAGLYEQFPEHALYVYQMEDGHRKHTGLIALNHVDDFLNGKIKKHENTLDEKEQQQIQLFLHLKALLKPVLLTYPSVAAIERWLEEFADNAAPLFSVRFEKDGQIHRIWPVTGQEDIRFLQELFATEVPGTYIADGHHRTTTIALLREQSGSQHSGFDFDHLFCVFLGADQLDILDFNRVTDCPEPWSTPDFFNKLSEIFEIEPLDAPRHPRHKHEICIYLDKTWHALQWKQEVLARYPAEKILLDTSLLNEWVLDDLLGIRDVRTDTRVTYIEGTRGLEGVRQATDKNRNRIGFVLFPVSFDDMVRTADAGETLPPKSTYFEPRIRSGLMVRLLEVRGEK